MKKVLSFLLVFFIFLSAQSQVVLNMKKVGGVYEVPCKVNGLNLSFIFDTGASDVSISLIEALFMIRHGYLKEENILGKVQYSIANGDIAEGTKILLKEIEIGGLKLYNVKASIVHEMSAPLLLGQSAIQKLGRITIDGDKIIIIDRNIPNSASDKESKFDENNYSSFLDKRNNKTYKTVRIKDQVWMAENLAYEPTSEENFKYWRNTGYNTVKNTTGYWGETIEGSARAFSYAEKEYYYNWGTALNVCPTGWHLPSHSEFYYLIVDIEGPEKAVEKLKSNSGWGKGEFIDPDLGWKMADPPQCQNGTNESGFNAIPLGFYFSASRYDYDKFRSKGWRAAFWTSTTEEDPSKEDSDWWNYDAIEFILDCESEKSNFYNSNRRHGYSVRCVRDLTIEELFRDLNSEESSETKSSNTKVNSYSLDVNSQNTSSIIIGSFGAMSNAERQKQTLIKEGFDNIDISKVGNVYRVSVLVSGSKEKVQEVHKRVKVYHKSAWISYK